MAAGMILAAATGALALVATASSIAPAAELPGSSGVPGPADPRISLVDLQRNGEDRRALAELDRFRVAEPERGRELGLNLLRGAILERLDRPAEAASAYASAIGEAPHLAPWARLRLAAVQERLGHPEVAAGVAATLLAQGAPRALADHAVDLLHSSLRRGGDCRLLGGLTGRIWPASIARTLELARAECELRRGELEPARRRLAALLADGTSDLAAFDAAELWLDRFPLPADRRQLAALGEALYEQRDFARAVPALEAALAGGTRSGSATESATLYRLARARFWLGQHGLAARTFEELFRTTRSTALAADARYQQARSLELGGDRAGAATLYREAFEHDRDGEWAGPALLARLRLDWLAGRELDAIALLEPLEANRKFDSALARGAIFLAASRIVAGSAGIEVTRWLDAAEKSDALYGAELSYWRGRAAELDGRPEQAVAAYIEAQRERPFHPWSLAARARLSRPEFLALTESAGRAAARGSTSEEAERAWIVFGPLRPPALAARARALAAMPRNAEVGTWIRWRPVPTPDWPLWKAPLTRPEDRLLALGLFRDGASALARHFPSGRRDLAFTAAQVLDAQHAHGLGIDLSERLWGSRPAGLREDWVSPDLRRLLFPLPYRQILMAQASVRRIDPWLLAAIFREESRFRPEAVSPAGARGVAQLVLPTARRLAANLGLRQPSAWDLHRPGVAIPLAASYLAELEGRFDGLDPAVLAAYNAGEAQTELWRGYCRSAEPEELLAKIGFRETRAYVARVLESRAHYAALYGL